MFQAEFPAAFPCVKRCRAWRVYLGDGRRLVDLYQDGGRAILGHTPPASLRHLKNAGERGLFAPYPTYHQRRFFAAVEKLFPGRKARFLNWGEGGRLLWRPFTPAPHQPFTPVLPHPLAPPVLVLAPGPEAPCENQFPVSGKQSAGFHISPPILAAVTRAIYDLLASPERGKAGYKKIDDALCAPDSQWRKNGIYIEYAPFTAESAESAKVRWAQIFASALKNGFLLPPTPDLPLILPGEMSAGEEGHLAAFLRNSTASIG